MLQFTNHAERRMNKRGISKEMIELTLEFGKYIEDKVVLKSRDIKRLLFKVPSFMKPKLLKIMDKGGLVVVLNDNNSVITVYNKFNK